MRLTTGQARTRVLSMTFRPGPSPLGGPRPNSTKDGGERGQHLEKTGTNQGEGNHARVRRPSRQLYNGTEGDSRGSHSGAVTSRQSLHGSHFWAVTSRQSLRGSHFTAVTSGQSLRGSRPTASLPVPPDSSRCHCLVVATRHVATM